MYLLYVSYANEHTRVTAILLHELIFTFKIGFFEKFNFAFLIDTQTISNNMRFDSIQDNYILSKYKLSRGE